MIGTNARNLASEHKHRHESRDLDTNSNVHRVSQRRAHAHRSKEKKIRSKQICSRKSAPKKSTLQKNQNSVARKLSSNRPTHTPLAVIESSNTYAFGYHRIIKLNSCASRPLYRSIGSQPSNESSKHIRLFLRLFTHLPHRHLLLLELLLLLLLVSHLVKEIARRLQVV